MPTLHALLVGINDYPHPADRLEGCRGDVRQFQVFLERHCPRLGYDLDLKLLVDQQASRAAVIDGFKLFDNTPADDHCLFFFAGHGSRCPAPEVFHHLQADKKLDSLVCHDSREPGGRDLMDKELSYLIWRAGQGKNTPFVTITDCCHSGVMRDLTKKNYKARELRNMGAGVTPEDFLGFEHFTQSDGGRHLGAPRGRRIHLAACRDKETAKEVWAGEEQRGIFTYCLLEALEQIDPLLLSYAELAGKLNLRVRNHFHDQSPQLDSTEPVDKDLIFLTTRPAERRPLLVSFAQPVGWQLKMGAIQGMPPVEDQSRTLLELEKDRHRIEVTQVSANHSTVNGMDEYDRNQVYPANVIRWSSPRCLVAFAEDSEEAGIKALQEEADRQAHRLFHFAPRNPNTSYLIDARNGGYTVTSLHDNAPLFTPLQGYTKAQTHQLLNELNRVANWRHLLDLQSPERPGWADQLQVELFHVPESDPSSDDAPAFPVDWSSKLPLLRQKQKNGEWTMPGFQLKIRNTARRTLWVSVLYMSHDFGITNRLLPEQDLAFDQESWAREVTDEGAVFRTALVQLEDAYYQKGIREVREFLKIIVATEKLNTDSWNQEPIPPDRLAAPYRSLVRRRLPQTQEWVTFTIPIAILREDKTNASS